MHYNHHHLIALLILLRKPNLSILLYIPHDVLTTFVVEESIVYTSHFSKGKLVTNRKTRAIPISNKTESLTGVVKTRVRGSRVRVRGKGKETHD